MKDTLKTMVCAARIACFLSALLLASFAQTTTEITDKSQPPDVVCTTTEIRNSIRDILQLENCTVVEGYIAILLIDFDGVSDFEAVSLPRLREITGYLLLYHVQFMKTLSNIFPNLSVIRGQKLFYHYAIVLFEMPSLQDIGLTSLTLIERGAVYAEKNPQLCYVNTIDWSRIMAVKDENRLANNKKVDECINMYPQNIIAGGDCPTSNIAVGDGLQPVPLCWNFRTCQKVCPAACSSGACYKSEVEGVKCCHSECIGGCSGPTISDCFACKAIRYNGRCQRNCPPGLYEMNGLRCVDEKGCRLSQARAKSRTYVIIEKDGRGLCLERCPFGFTSGANGTNKHRCFRCSGPCPKICQGIIMDNIQAAEMLDGCTVINGSLEIQIAGGNVLDLEKFMGQIEEVTRYVRIVNSNALTSLNFLKSLKMIRGEILYSGHALFIHHNRNLDDIWDLETHPNLTVQEGKVAFLDNPKLCVEKIQAFLAITAQVNKSKDEADILSTNGELAACQIYDLSLMIKDVGPISATATWEKFNMTDVRYHIGWVVNYRQTPDDTPITIHAGREVCGDDVWKTMDVKAESMSASIKGLHPYTNYAVYVMAYMASGVKRGAMSPLVYFRTVMSAPTPVRKLCANAAGASDLQLTWIEPEVPNGIITHYIVSWSVIEINETRVEMRNYCVDRIRQAYQRKDSKTSREDRTSVSSSSASELNGKCCQCPKSPQQLELEQRERQFDITFENHLHNFVYIKYSPGISTRVISKRSVETSENRSEATAETGTESDSTLSPSTDTMAAALGIASTAISEPITTDSAMEEVRPLRWRQMNSTVVIGNASFIITGLKHFQEYWIEVTACHGLNSSETVLEDSCSKPAMTVARTHPDDKADNIDMKTVTISRGDNDTYLVQWLSPPNPNSLTVAFEIEMSKVDIENYKPDVHCITHKTYRELNGTRFEKVMNWGNWSYRVRTLSLAGNGSWTPVQYFLIESPEQSSSDLQNLLGALAVIPLIAILIAVISYFVIRYKRQFAYPEVMSFNPEYVNPEDLYIPDGWEVERDQVALLDALGQGSFGMVYRGLLRYSSDDDKEPIEVAVKTVMESSTLRDRIAFLNEASVMKAFESYHVVKLLGIVSKGQPSLVIMELMSNGDLKTFLRKHRPDDLENEGMQPPTLKLILQMAGEIADGMAYLSSKKFVHRDLAARNCMVSNDLTVKIGDFGLTRDIYATDYYRKNTKGLLPVRWMAPESLKDGVFTMHSDVWSYGIVLWEMATLATQPYQGLSNEEVLHYVIDGGKMTIPDKCPEKLVNLMSICWNSTPKKRPTFEDVIEFLLPDLNSDFSDVSYYSTRNGEEGLDDMKDREEEEHEGEEEEEEENSRTPLSISFAPIRSVSQTTGQRDTLTNGLSPRVGHGGNSKSNITKPVLELFKTDDDDLSRSSSYPRLHPSHEGPSSNGDGSSRYVQIRSGVKSAVNLLTSLVTSSRPDIVSIADIRRNSSDQLQHQLVAL